MPIYYQYRCLKCGRECERHCNAKKCRCGGDLVRVYVDDGKCPTCGRPFKTESPVRFCRKCKQPILRGHKYRWINLGGNLTTIEHRNCEDPQSYKPESK
jgi:hypothetical protein